MSLKDTFIETVESLRDELVHLARELIRIPSENPPGDESLISEFASERLRALGIQVELVAPKPKRVNTLGVLRGAGGGQNLLYNGHYDTVPAGSLEFWTVDPFDAVVKDGRIYGRGASDMKGSIASMIIAAKALVEAGVRLKGDLLIHMVADEETGSKHGTRHLVESGHVSLGKVDMAMVGEGSVYKDEINIRTAVRGLQWLKIVTRGKAVHSSRPGEGVNAVLKMCKILLALNKHRFRFTPHELLPDPTVAPGTLIKGGMKENIIPELCEAVCDVRVVPGMTSEAILDEVRSVIASLKEEDPEIDANVSSISWWPPSEISTSQEIYKAAKRSAEAVTGYELKPIGTSGSNDTAWLTNIAKIPAIAFGPGDNYRSGVHGPDEWVSINRLVDFAKIYGLMAMEICHVHE